MVDSDRGITNLHVPSDVIIDASMPAAIRTSGQMWNADGELQDTKFVIPDHSYAPLYAETVDHCREHGAFDPATMGTTPNVGLMAQSAEEYGSHDKTFEIEAAGTVRVRRRRRPRAAGARGAGRRHLAHVPDQARPDPRLGPPGGASAPGPPAAPAVFWLDETRAHDEQLLAKVAPGARRARHRRADRSRSWTSPTPPGTRSSAPARGENTISVTGNVLRDYLTDLFPILELGTSAKMQSIVPLMAGGGLFETGAGGSAPKHVQQFLRENHLRWDSLGEFLALVPSLELLADARGQPAAPASSPRRSTAPPAACSRRTAHRRARPASSTTAAATSTSRCTGPASSPTRTRTPISPPGSSRWPSGWSATRSTIVEELDAVQGEPVDIGGYYRPDPDEAMRRDAALATTLQPSAPSRARYSSTP